MFRGKEYIYEIYKEKSFSAAAQKLFLTQPALSNHVRRIESRIGSPIFDRSTSPIQLTEVGQNYIHAVEQIMGIEENFSHYLADTQNLQTGVLRIGSSALLSSYVLPELLAEYKKRFPYVEITIIEGTASALQKNLEEGVIDLFVESEELSKELFRCLTYQKEHLVLAVPRAWKINDSLLAWQQSLENIVSGKFLAPYYPYVPLEKFKDCPFLMISQESKSRQRTLALCEHHGFAPNIILTVNQHLTAYNMTCAGIGASFVSDTLIRNSSSTPDVVYYKLEPEFSQKNIYLYYKANRYVSYCMREFLALVERMPQPHS